ncbi:hypothetical protein CRD60_08270, partial [Bifidobacterium aemilianum]
RSRGLNPQLLIRAQFEPFPNNPGVDRWIECGGYQYFANSYADATAYDKEPRLNQPHKTYESGSVSERTIIAHNEEEICGTRLKLNWRLIWQSVADGSCHTTKEDSWGPDTHYAEHWETPASIQMPVEAEGEGANLVLTLTVHMEGQKVHREDNFLGWIDQAGGTRLTVRGTERNPGTQGWESWTVKHVVHLPPPQEASAMSERWTSHMEDDAKGAFQLEEASDDFCHE